MLPSITKCLLVLMICYILEPSINSLGLRWALHFRFPVSVKNLWPATWKMEKSWWVLVNHTDCFLDATFRLGWWLSLNFRGLSSQYCLHCCKLDRKIRGLPLKIFLCLYFIPTLTILILQYPQLYNLLTVHLPRFVQAPATSISPSCMH